MSAGAVAYSFWLDTSYACALVSTDARGVVAWAAPVYRRRMVGRRFRDVLADLRAAGQFRRWHRYPDPIICR